MRLDFLVSAATLLLAVTGIEAAPMPSPVPVPSAVRARGAAAPAEATPAPRWLPQDSTPDQVQAFYAPMQQWARSKASRGDKSLQPDQRAWPRELREAKKLAGIVGRAGNVNRAERIALERLARSEVETEAGRKRLAELEERQAAREDKRAARTVTKRSDIPSVPLSEMPYPSFPAEYPSWCVLCPLSSFHSLTDAHFGTRRHSYNCEQKYSSISSCAAASSVFENATSIFNDPFAYISVIKCSW